MKKTPTISTSDKRERSIVLLLKVLVLLSLTSCEKSPLRKQYEDVGQYPDRVTAEKEVLKHLVDQYAKLPRKWHYKVKFSFDIDATPGFIWKENAVWYDKQTEELGLETDINSGMTCSWKGVNQQVLNALVNANRGLVAADSLAQPSYGSYAKTIAQ